MLSLPVTANHWPTVLHSLRLKQHVGGNNDNHKSSSASVPADLSAGRRYPTKSNTRGHLDL